MIAMGHDVLHYNKELGNFNRSLSFFHNFSRKLIGPKLN